MYQIIIKAKTEGYSITEPFYFVQLSENGKCAVTMEEGTNRKKIKAAIHNLQYQYDVLDADIIEQL